MLAYICIFEIKNDEKITLKIENINLQFYSISYSSTVSPFDSGFLLKTKSKVKKKVKTYKYIPNDITFIGMYRNVRRMRVFRYAAFAL